MNDIIHWERNIKKREAVHVKFRYIVYISFLFLRKRIGAGIGILFLKELAFVENEVFINVLNFIQ